MKAVVAAFNQEKALVGAFSVIVQLHRLIDLRHYLESKVHLGHVQAVADALRGLNSGSSGFNSAPSPVAPPPASR